MHYLKSTPKICIQNHISISSVVASMTAARIDYLL